VVSPIDSNHALIGVVEADFGFLNLFKVNCANSGVALWKKGITCPSGISCALNYGEAILSSDGTKFYITVDFDDHFLFYTLSEATGEVISTMYKYNHSATGGTIGNFIEAQDRLYLHFSLTNNQVLVYNVTTNKFDYSWWESKASVDLQSIRVSKNDFMILTGLLGTASLIFESYYSTFSAFPAAVNSAFAMDSFSSGNYLIVDRSASGEVNYNSYVSGSYDSFDVGDYYTYATSAQTIVYAVSVWNLDHYEPDLLPNTRYELNFSWTCYIAPHTKTITYSLVSIEGESVPNWASIDLVNKKVVLDKTPTEPGVYKFGFSAAYDIENEVKNIYLTVKG
jgi:hypothetical protein